MLSVWQNDSIIHIDVSILFFRGFPGGSEVKASACNVRDPGSITGSGRFPGEGNGNPMDGKAW